MVSFFPHFITGKHVLLLLKVLRSQALELKSSLLLNSYGNGNLLAPFMCHIPSVNYHDDLGPNSQDYIVD